MRSGPTHLHRLSASLLEIHKLLPLYIESHVSKQTTGTVSYHLQLLLIYWETLALSSSVTRNWSSTKESRVEIQLAILHEISLLLISFTGTQKRSVSLSLNVTWLATHEASCQHYNKQTSPPRMLCAGVQVMFNFVWQLRPLR